MSPTIDLVYLWVDGSDPQWCQRKNKYLAHEGQDEIQLAVPERWRDNDELKYSLRSAEMFLPWINHIFIVTDQQRPAWLNTRHPKITLVDHRDFIPEQYLPLFAADAIEMFLPFIPGLSEHFLFANDDMFFGRKVSQSMFYDVAGNPKVLVKKLDKCGNYYSRVRANSLVSDLFHCDLNWEGGHVIDPCRRSYMLEALHEPAFQEAIEITRCSRFRSPQATQRILFPLYDACKKRTSLIDIRRFREWKRLFAPHRLTYYISKESDFKKILNIKPFMFCYFDQGLDVHDSLHDFFSRYFPRKSDFEL